MAKKRNERTSADVAKLAAKWLAKKLPFDHVHDVCGDKVGGTKYVMISQREWREIAQCLASCLTQAPDKPKPKPRRKP